MNILNIDLSQCIGCNNCVNACNHNAIHLYEDHEGFMYPNVDIEKCIDCSLCTKKCPLFVRKNRIDCNKKILIAKSINKDNRFNGSSGGFFPTLSNYYFKKGTIIYGAIYDSNSKKIIHTSTNDYPLTLIYKSKYAQSDINNVFKKIKQDLKNDLSIIFVGTPCQVSALYLFLGNKPKNLITIDFICHGVASPGFFRNFLQKKELKTGKKISNITFRDKNNGWRKASTKITYNDGTYEMLSNTFNYYYAFTHNYSLRKCCFKCSYAKNHESDITMADAWHKVDKDDTGLSMISINSELGEHVFEPIKNDFLIQNEKLTIWEKYDYAHNYNQDKRTRFFYYYTKLNYNDFELWFEKQKKREAIIDKIKVRLGKIKRILLRKNTIYK